MERYANKNPYPTLIVPAIALLFPVLFYSQIRVWPLLGIVPALLLLIGAYASYRAFTFRICVDDASIRVRNIEIPWNRVKNAIVARQMVESGHGTEMVKVLCIVYLNGANRRKTLAITLKNLNRPTAFMHSIEKRVTISSLDGKR